jgi:hypothetical protein
MTTARERRRQLGVHAALCLLVLPAYLAAQQPGGAAASLLKIVVLAGEGAVNIIQQKTAVNPIVEVRDRNNLPVSGVAVTFSVGGQGASFAGGASTLTLTTNAAGQAVATGLAPTATGAVTINATAVVNGQTIAATITQTNFATAQAAAQAAATAGGGSSAASGAGATAGGGGGGISGTTLAIAGAAVGGGALAATQLKGGGGDGDAPTHSGTFSGQMTMTFPGNSPQQSCSRVHAITGTLRIELQEGSTAGTADIEGNNVVVSGNCGSGPQPGARENLGMPTTQVTGSAGALAFTSEVTNSFPAMPPAPAGLGTVRWVFTGTLAGNVINGSLTLSLRGESPGSGFPPGTGMATFTVTLQ